LALWLAKKGKQVTLVEEMDELLAANGPLCHANSDMLKALIPYHGIKVLTSTKVIRATEKGVLVHANGEEKEIEADTVVLAIGFDPDKTLYDELKHDFADIHRIGDARRVANIMYAIWDAYEVASTL
jgi:2-enoate reductase